MKKGKERIREDEKIEKERRDELINQINDQIDEKEENPRKLKMKRKRMKKGKKRNREVQKIEKRKSFKNQQRYKRKFDKHVNESNTDEANHKIK